MFKINNWLLPKSEHDALLILTDLEPDDVLAIYILRKRLDAAFPILVVLGEGDLNKTGMADGLFTQLGFTNFKTIQGPYSNFEYYSNYEYPNEAIHIFGDNVGKQFQANIYFEEIEKFLGEFVSPLILGIKPFTELLNVDPTVLSKCVLAMYGGFNLRCMTNNCLEESVAKLINNAFKYVILYETFFVTGEQNSINKNNAPKLFETLVTSQDLVLRGIVKLMGIWNDHIADECLKTISDVCCDIRRKWPERQFKELKEHIDQIQKRHLKIVNSIVDAESTQMVLADFGLTALLVWDSVQFGEVKTGNISFDSMGYTIHTQEEDEPSTYVGPVYRPSRTPFLIDPNSKVLNILNVGMKEMISIVTNVVTGDI